MARRRVQVTVRILYVVLLSLTMAVLAACGSNGNGTEQAPTATPNAESAASGASAVSARGGVVRVINRDRGGSGEYRFDPAKLRFEVGQEVTFSLSGETEFHTFTVDELGIDVSMDVGETVEYTYTFDKAGTFKLTCIPHEALGMTGEIVVE